MTSKTHIAAGTMAALLLSHYSKCDPIYAFSGCILGSILPDLDTEQSWISQSIPYADDIVRMVGSGAKKKKNKKVHNVLKHRGLLTHSILTLIIAGAFLYYFQNYFVAGILAGIGSHLLLDKITNLKIVSTGTKSEETFYNISWIMNFSIIIFVAYSKYKAG